MVLSYRRGSAEERAFWTRCMERGENDDAELQEAIALLRKHNAIEDTVERARHYGAVARDALAPLADNAHKSALLDVIAFCIARAY